MGLHCFERGYEDGIELVSAHASANGAGYAAQGTRTATEEKGQKVDS